MPHLYLMPIEYFWLTLTVAWTAFSVVVLAKYRTYLRAARHGTFAVEADRAYALDLARDFIRAERFRLAQHLASIVAGIVVATVPPIRALIIDHAAQRHVVGVIFSLCLIVINCCAGANSINAWFSYRRRAALARKAQ